MNESVCSGDNKMPALTSHNLNRDDQHQFDHQQLGKYQNLDIASRISQHESQDYSQQQLQRVLNRSLSPEVLERVGYTSSVNRDKKGGQGSPCEDELHQGRVDQAIRAGVEIEVIPDSSLETEIQSNIAFSKKDQATSPKKQTLNQSVDTHEICTQTAPEPAQEVSQR